MISVTTVLLNSHISTEMYRCIVPCIYFYILFIMDNYCFENVFKAYLRDIDTKFSSLVFSSKDEPLIISFKLFGIWIFNFKFSTHADS